MFKIKTIENQAQCTLAVQGSLVGPWLPELQRTWDEARQRREAGMLVVDLTEVTVVSQHGENILFRMMAEGGRLVGNSLIARVVIQQLERRRHQQHENAA
jgi:hypothetical protein